MELYIKNKSLETIGIIDNTSSVIWTKRYNEFGDFEIYVRASKTLLDIVKPTYYVTRFDDDMVGIIEKITLTTDVENGDYITIVGRDILSLLTRRVFIGTSKYNNLSPEVVIRNMVDKNCINTDMAIRKINEMILGDYRGLTTDTTIDMQVTGSNLYNEVVDLAKRFNLGLKMTLNDNNNFVFDIYKSTDRSYNQSAVPFVVFSDDYFNLVNTTYTYDATEYKNVAVVAGQGEGSDRVWETTYTKNWKNIDRYEMFVDAKDVESIEQTPKTIGGATSTHYELAERGQNELAEVEPITTFEGDVDTSRTYKYKSDYFVGDIVQIKNEYGLTATAQITEIIESEDENGYSVIPTFAEWEVN